MSAAFQIGLFIIFSGILLFSIWYVPARLKRLMPSGRSKALHISFILLVPLCLIAMFSPGNTSRIFGIISIASGIVFMFHIYLFIFLPVFDIGSGMLKFSRHFGLFAAVAVSTLLTLYGALNADRLTMREVETVINGLKRDVNIMHISDVHLGYHRGRSYLEKIVEETNRMAPDLVLITGDLVDNNIALEPNVLLPLKDIKAPAYFTTGNHEFYVDTQKAFDLITRYGVRILRNEMIQTHGFQLVGLDYMKADEHAFDAHAVNQMTIKDELPKIGVSDDEPVILMHHSPVGLDYVRQAGVSLMLAGHTHAGQVFPATLVTPFWLSVNKGLAIQENTSVFVSEGAGTYGPRMRLGSTNEITLLKLKKNRF